MSKLAMSGGTPVRTKPFPVWPMRDERERAALLEVWEKPTWSSGPGYYRADPAASKARQLEAKFAAYHDSKHAIATGSGTDAIQIGFKICGVGLGDEVIVPAETFIATVTPILQLGGIPVFVDIDPETRCIDPEAVEAAITPRTRCIAPVHLTGRPADMDRIMDIAARHGIEVMADCAHAHGSEWRGKKVAAVSQAGAFSLQQEKGMTAGGEGGILVTSDDTKADWAHIFQNDGRGLGDEGWQYQGLGWNFRMSEFQAAIALVQLERLDSVIDAKTRAVGKLKTAFADMGGLRFPADDPRITRQSYLYPWLHYNREAFGGIPAKTFCEAVRAEGIPFHGGSDPDRALYKHPIFTEKRYGMAGYQSRIKHPAEAVDYTQVHCPVAEGGQVEGIGFPQTVLLGEEGDIQDVIDAVGKVVENIEELAKVTA